MGWVYNWCTQGGCWQISNLASSSMAEGSANIPDVNIDPSLETRPGSAAVLPDMQMQMLHSACRCWGSLDTNTLTTPYSHTPGRPLRGSQVSRCSRDMRTSGMPATSTLHRMMHQCGPSVGWESGCPIAQLRMTDDACTVCTKRQCLA
jgi:hypothetical protein